MWVWLPKEWLIPGQPQTIKIVGQAEGSNSWIIVYQATDALDFLLNSAKYSTWSELTATPSEKNYNVIFKSPQTKAGEKITVSYGKEKHVYQLTPGTDCSITSFTLPKSVSGKALTIKDETGKILVQEQFGKTGNQTILIPKSLLKIECSKQKETIEIRTLRTYKPATIESLASLAQSPASKGKIFLMNSSHQDIAWMDSPEKCVILRDTMLLTPLFEIGSRNPDYRFDVEDALMIKEYVTRHPDKRGLVQQMLNNGNISCGSTYIQPYEEMYSGEALARQFYFGSRWLKKEFNYTANTYWNQDVPGRTLQMPQIMRKAGTKNLMFSRQEKGLYHWYSPDGSFITAYSPGHYGDAYVQLNKTFYDAALFISQQALYFNKYYNPGTKQPVTPILSDWDMSAARDYSGIIKQWHDINQLEVNDDQIITAKLPEFKIVTAPEFFAAVEKEQTSIPKIKGERPALWLYIHGPTHHKAITASREADILLPMAEKFATANALVKGNFDGYPFNRLNDAWEAKIFPDHGWGGKNGQITDDLFLEKFQFARSEAKAVLEQSLNELASSIITDPSKGIAVVVFNSLNWIRTGTVSVNMKPEMGKETIIRDENGKICITSNISSGAFSFIAENVPACGYKTFYLNRQEPAKAPTLKTGNQNSIATKAENKYYSVTFVKGGLKGIYDKELKRELLNTEKFYGGEVFTMRSEGSGAGEFTDIQQPSMDGFDKTSLHAGDWQMLDSNNISSKFSFRCKIRNAEIEETLVLFHNQKRIDFNVSILNWEGEIYREYRMAMPLRMADAQVSYEVPFGVVNVGKDEMEGAPGERHKTLCKDMHPRGILNWISASDKNSGVTLSSSVAVADWIDPTTDPVNYVVLQPLLMAARRSCHPEGNEYLQTGDHHFSFSLTSHAPGWQNGYRNAIEANENMQVVINPSMYKQASLPAELSFFSTDNDNLQVSTVKRAEDDHGFVVRVFDIMGKDTEAKLKFFKPVVSGSQTDLLEYPQHEIKTNTNEASIEVGHYGIETFLFK
jgi:alpha-mannosidase